MDMNAPSLSEIRSSAGRELTDEKMDQVRELLVGDAMRRVEVRVAALETRLAEVELGLSRQLDALEARIDALAGAAASDRQLAFEALAGSVGDLSEQIRRISRS